MLILRKFEYILVHCQTVVRPRDGDFWASAREVSRLYAAELSPVLDQERITKIAELVEPRARPACVVTETAGG